MHVNMHTDINEIYRRLDTYSSLSKRKLIYNIIPLETNIFIYSRFTYMYYYIPEHLTHIQHIYSPLDNNYKLLYAHVSFVRIYWER